jgi:hypothetical protein
MKPRLTALPLALTAIVILALAIVSGLAFFDQFWAVLAWVAAVVGAALLVGLASIKLGNAARRRS